GTRRNVDLVCAKRVARHGLGRRPVREIQTDARPVGFGLASRMIVDLQGDIGPAANLAANSVRGKARSHTWSPGSESSVRQIDGPRNAKPSGEAWHCIGQVTTTGIAGFIEIDPAVMCGPAIARSKLDAVDRDIVVQRNRQAKRTVDIWPAWRNMEALGHLEDQVRHAELPTVRILWRRGSLGNVTPFAAGLSPFSERFQFRH